MANFAIADVFAEIDKQAAALGISARNAKALAVAENTGSGSTSSRSSYSGGAVSPAGAAGVMQVMPATASALQATGFLPADWKHDPDNLSSQVQAGLAAMKEKLGRMRNPDDLDELASVYNGSSRTHAAFKAGELDKLPSETKQYMLKLRRAAMELDGNTGTPATGSTASSTRTTTRRTVSDPASMEAFMTDITGAAGGGGMFDQTMDFIRANGASRNQTSQELAAYTLQAGQAAGEEAAAMAGAKAAGDFKRARILETMRLNPDAANNEMQRVLAQITNTEEASEPLAADIRARMSVGFFDNPVEWLINQTRLPGMVAQHNGIVEQQQSAMNRYKSLASVASTQQGLSANTDGDNILRAGTASATAATAKAMAEQARIGLQTADANQRDAMTIAALTGQKVSMLGAAVNASKQSITESVGESERVAAGKAEQANFDSVNAQIKAAGGVPIANLTLFKSMNPAERTRLVQLASSGKFGKDLASSTDFVDNLGDVGRMAFGGDATAAAWVSGTVAEASKNTRARAATAAARGGKPIDTRRAAPEDIADMQNKYQTEANADMRNASPYNPFKIDYAAVTQQLSKDPALAGNSVVQWINLYGPKGSKKLMDKVDEQFLFNKMADGIMSGRFTAATAVKEITAFYTAATALQAMNSKWPIFGLDKPAKGYAVQLGGMGAGSSTGGPVDFTNPAQVENALTRKVVVDTAYKFANQNTGFFDGAQQ